ncbi:MAG: protein kinase [bacterium]
MFFGRRTPAGFYPEHKDVIYRRYEVIEIIGTGVTSIVIVCIDLSTKMKVAVKRFYPEKMTKKLAERISQEIKLKLKSEYLVKAEQCFEENGIKHIVMPLVDGKTLRDVIAINDRIDEISAAHFSLCLAKAALCLGKEGIQSCDVKPENAIVTTERVILIDLNCFERIGSRPEVSKGTPPYSPPELVKRDCLSAKTDVYSVGVIMAELMLGNDAFSGMAARWSQNAENAVKPDITLLVSEYPDAARIIDRALEPDQRKRIGTEELICELSDYLDSLTGSATPGRLVLVFSNGRQIPLTEGKTILGRNAIDPANLYISESHFELDLAGNAVKMRNLSKVNPAKVNGAKIDGKWVNLNITDVVQAANVQMTLQMA